MRGDMHHARKGAGVCVRDEIKCFFNITAAEKAFMHRVPGAEGLPQIIKNSIAFGSAPRREGDSQPSVSQIGQQSVRQKHTLWVFCQ